MSLRRQRKDDLLSVQTDFEQESIFPPMASLTRLSPPSSSSKTKNKINFFSSKNSSNQSSPKVEDNIADTEGKLSSTSSSRGKDGKNSIKDNKKKDKNSKADKNSKTKKEKKKEEKKLKKNKSGNDNQSNNILNQNNNNILNRDNSENQPKKKSIKHYFEKNQIMMPSNINGTPTFLLYMKDQLNDFSKGFNSNNAENISNNNNRNRNGENLKSEENPRSEKSITNIPQNIQFDSQFLKENSHVNKRRREHSFSGVNRKSLIEDNENLQNELSKINKINKTLKSSPKQNHFAYNDHEQSYSKSKSISHGKSTSKSTSNKNTSSENGESHSSSIDESKIEKFFMVSQKQMEDRFRVSKPDESELSNLKYSLKSQTNQAKFQFSSVSQNVDTLKNKFTSMKTQMDEASKYVDEIQEKVMKLQKEMQEISDQFDDDFHEEESMTMIQMLKFYTMKMFSYFP
ncbi:hypothetical protein TRFO_09997 [Tritrichomonas foetus]|uniref:Uncharacterized protein n=1 Tax=Tritrichomonas foetus TaxID=1144522 RepID=A0A1J4JGL5_9EUKA|nr:hypothetical protein TRFO_09997 [Tritrichomonas foetus]|eukprot:OHS96348.1 hypothetical protein TRFO_09997 [Tritrichomonas foetus]